MFPEPDASSRHDTRSSVWIPPLTIFLLSMLLSFATYLYAGLPLPVLHDEFACLLQADTFAHGRLTNPPHPMASHLEAFHILQHPTYQAKFPPGYALFLALGQVIWEPALGSWISIAIGCSAITWMLLAWFPKNWAMLGGALAASALTTHLLTTSYWGGGVAMAGGALVCRATIRILRSPSWKDGAVAGLGAMLLFNSRPFEGTMLCLMLGCVALFSAYRLPTLRKPTFLRALPGALCVMLPLLMWDGYYNARVTGSPWQLPYALHSQQYMRAPLMFWQSPHTPTVDAPEPLKHFHQEIEWEEYETQTNWPGYLAKAKTKVIYLFRTYFYPRWLLLPIGMSLLKLRRSQAARWFWTICIVLPLLHMCLTPWMRWIYMMPLLGLMMAADVVGFMWMDRWKLAGWRIGRILVVLIIGAQLLNSVAWAKDADRTSRLPPIELRASLLRQLKQVGGKHLVFVSTSPESAAIDIVFNGADIDGSPVIFARDLGPAKNAELLACYPDRVAWHVDESLHVTRYPR